MMSHSTRAHWSCARSSLVRAGANLKQPLQTPILPSKEPVLDETRHEKTVAEPSTTLVRARQQAKVALLCDRIYTTVVPQWGATSIHIFFQSKKPTLRMW